MTAQYHAFANGELLTAQKVNDYLMRQAVIVCANSTERDTIPTPPNGMQVYLQDTDTLQIRSAGAWLSFDTRPIAYTPANTNFTIGNGSSYCWYKRDGQMVDFQIVLVRGSTSSGAGAIQLGLPFPAHADYYAIPNAVTIASGQLVDSGVNRYSLTGQISNGVPASKMIIEVTPAAVTNTSPFNQGTGDQIGLSGRYRMA